MTQARNLDAYACIKSGYDVNIITAQINHAERMYQHKNNLSSEELIQIGTIFVQGEQFDLAKECALLAHKKQSQKIVEHQKSTENKEQIKETEYCALLAHEEKEGVSSKTSIPMLNRYYYINSVIKNILAHIEYKTTLGNRKTLDNAIKLFKEAEKLCYELTDHYPQKYELMFDIILNSGIAVFYKELRFPSKTEFPYVDAMNLFHRARIEAEKFKPDENHPINYALISATNYLALTQLYQKWISLGEGLLVNQMEFYKKNKDQSSLPLRSKKNTSQIKQEILPNDLAQILEETNQHRQQDYCIYLLCHAIYAKLTKNYVIALSFFSDAYGLTVKLLPEKANKIAYYQRLLAIAHEALETAKLDEKLYLETASWQNTITELNCLVQPPKTKTSFAASLFQFIQSAPKTAQFNDKSTPLLTDAKRLEITENAKCLIC